MSVCSSCSRCSVHCFVCECAVKLFKLFSFSCKLVHPQALRLFGSGSCFLTVSRPNSSCYMRNFYLKLFCKCSLHLTDLSLLPTAVVGWKVQGFAEFLFA